MYYLPFIASLRIMIISEKLKKTIWQTDLDNY